MLHFEKAIGTESQLAATIISQYAAWNLRGCRFQELVLVPAQARTITKQNTNRHLILLHCCAKFKWVKQSVNSGDCSKQGLGIRKTCAIFHDYNWTLWKDLVACHKGTQSASYHPNLREEIIHRAVCSAEPTNQASWEFLQLLKKKWRPNFKTSRLPSKQITTLTVFKPRSILLSLNQN